MRRAVLGVALAGATFGAGGCFGVHNSDPGILLIDNFEDGDYLPADPTFGVWQCDTFNPNNQVFSCGRDVGYDSTYSLALSFTVTDPPDGQEQFGGASLLTQAYAPQDFSHFSELVLSLELQSELPSIPSTAFVYVVLLCEGALADAGSEFGDLEVLQSVPYQNGWGTFALSMANFTAPSWAKIFPPGGLEQCLKQVNLIKIQVSPGLPDGLSAKGQLNVDNIYLR